MKAGYFDEPDDVIGIAHVLEHMYFKGTPTRGVGQIARETKAAGGYLNAGTIYDHTHYYVVLPSAGFAAGLAVQADAYANSVLDAGELARELEVIIEETKRKADTPSALALETLFEVLHDQHRIRRWRMGREDGLRALTRDHLHAFYKRFYRPSNTVLAIVGDVDPDEAIALVATHYGHLPDAPVGRSLSPQERTPAGFRCREWEGDIAQTELLVGWRTPPLEHPDTPALDVLATVLGVGRASRLARAVRDRRLASSITAYDYTPTELGVFVIHAGTRPETMREAAGAIWDQVRRVRAGEITAAEVDRARALVEAQVLRRFESPEGQANFLGAWELLGDWQQGVSHHEALLRVDAARLAAVATRWLDPEQATVLAYRPRGTAPLGTDAVAVRAMLDAARPTPIDPMGTPLPAPPIIGDGARYERGVDAIHCFRTARDVPILVQRRPGASLVHLGVVIPGGAVEERPDESGLTTLMARTALRGTARRSAARIAEDAERLGGVPAVGVGSEVFEWTMGVSTRAFADAAELLADVVLAPTYPEDGLEAERAVALAALGTLRDDMYRQPMRLASEAAWAGHPYGRSPLGDESVIRGATVDRVAAWHAARVNESAAALVVVGDLDPQEAADTLARRFAALRAAPAPAIAPTVWPTAFTERVDQRDRAQTALAMLFPGPARTDEARFGAELLAGIASGLGGRLFEELRDKRSLAYTVLARSMLRLRAGAIAAYIATSPHREAEAREGLLRELQRFIDAPVTAEELDRARRHAIGAWQLRQASGSAVLGAIAEAWVHGTLEEVARYPHDLARVTPSTLQGAARHWFDASRRVEGIVRGRTT
ncbi:MAG: insulinase family protein [Gemmatimonadetes bacterium]|nr:insulinase family protein [Gemmatimonadota bacterium]